MQVEEYIPLASLTTFRIGGAARYFVRAHSADDVREALVFATERNLPVAILGGGSNVLIADHGFSGLVLIVDIKGIAEEGDGAAVMVTVGAGESWDGFVEWAIEKNLSGVENLSGIPGTVGGAVVANNGAYGAQCSDVLVSAQVFDRALGKIEVLPKDACNFSYHDSIFGQHKDRYIILRAAFLLRSDVSANLSYRDSRFDLSGLIQTLGREPTLTEIRSAILDVREKKGYLAMEGRESFKSAGCFFHMPYVSAGHYEKVLAKARDLDAAKEERLRPWAWLQSDGTYKLAPGFLLEYTEFIKGFRRGSVGISPRHTLSIINIDGASAHNVAELARDMQSAVKDVFGVELEREVEYIGDVK